MRSEENRTTFDLAGLTRSRFNVNLGPESRRFRCLEKDIQPKRLFSTSELSSSNKVVAQLSKRPRKKIGVTSQTVIRWKNEFGGLKVDQAKRLKELEQENARLKKIVANQALENSMLKEVASGNF